MPRFPGDRVLSTPPHFESINEYFRDSVDQYHIDVCRVVSMIYIFRDPLLEKCTDIIGLYVHTPLSVQT